MEFGYKVTTNGRNVLAACMGTETPLRLTRVAIGSGTVAEGVDLADVHELLSYVADGEIAERSHEDERLNITVQYANSLHPGVPTFYLAEFMIFAEDPDTGEETDLIYATLGDYKQPVPAYIEGIPGSLFNMPLVVVVSSDIEVEIAASPGLVTYAQLDESVNTAARKIMDELQPGWSVCGTLQLTIPAADWQEVEAATSDYAYTCDVEAEGVTSVMTPMGAPLPGYFDISTKAGVLNCASVFNGYVRFYSKRVPTDDIVCSLTLLRLGSSGGGGGSVDPGVGLGLGMDGKLNVLLGNGLSVDSANKINVDHREVVTEDDMLDEDETEESVKNILLKGSDAENSGE